MTAGNKKPTKKAGTVKKTAPKKGRSAPALSLLKFPRPSMVSQLATRSAEKINPRWQAVIDRSEIAEVLAKYARGIDRLDENMLRAVLHHDATMDYGPGVFQGTASDFVLWALGVYQGVRSSHHLIGNVRVELDGDVALVESYFQAHIRIEKPVGREDILLGGRYLDRLERRPNGPAGIWKIMHRKQVLDWARTESAADIFYHQNPDALWSVRNKIDPSYQMANFPGTQSGGRLPSFLGRHYESKSVKF